MPKTRSDFWSNKLAGNAQRDRENTRLLKKLGWKVIVVWECELTDEVSLQERLYRMLVTDGA